MSIRTEEEVDKIVNNMTDYEVSRWSALLFGIEKVADMAEAKRLDFNTIHIDQPALDKYVDEVADDVLFAMQSKEILKENRESNPALC